MNLIPASETTLSPTQQPGLHRHFGLIGAIALNVTMIVGAGVFANIPLILKELPGPYALLAWLAAGFLILLDGLVWSELATMMPGSGGSYRYLLEGYGQERWGRMMSFLFIWQFLLSGPLELASGLIAMTGFAAGLSPKVQDFVERHTYWKGTIWEAQNLTLTVDIARLAGILLGLALIFALYRRVSTLGKMTVALWIGVLAVIAWILVEGGLHFQPSVAFDWPAERPADFANHLGMAMILAMYAYLGYYNICYMGDEVRDPGRTLPRAILASALLVMVLFAGLHLAILGTVDWKEVAKAPEENYNLAAVFMTRIHGEDSWTAILVTGLLVWTCLGSVFAGLLSYSRIPYGAARYGHFFSVFRKVHPTHHIPHVSLLLVGGLMLCWSFFDLANVINALVTTRILEQFVAQILVLVLLRRQQPDRKRPFRIWFYPLPCGLALIGWVFLYANAGRLYILLGLSTLAAGLVAFVLWSHQARQWPFAPPRTEAD